MAEIQKAESVTKISDRFYELDLVVDSNEWDTVYSYFKKIMNDPDIANNFATIVFRISKKNDVNALELLESLKGQDGMSLTMSMAYMMNNDRSNSVLLGVGNIITPDYYAARNVIQ